MDANNFWTDDNGRFRDQRGRFAREVISHRHDPTPPTATNAAATATDPNLTRQFEQFKAEQSQQLKAIRDELAKLSKSSTDTNQRVKRGFESVEEKLCWDALLQDAIMATCICAVVGTMAAYRWTVTTGAAQAHDWVLKFTPNLFDKPVSKLLDEVLPVTDAQAATTEGAIALPLEQQAFLDTIAQMEGADYGTIYSGLTFTDFSQHPKQCIPIDVPGYEGQCSDASGRYQFISTTWYGEDGIAGGVPGVYESLGLQDFSPESQDKGAIALIERDAPDALRKLDRGDIDGAFCAVGRLWASLPCNSYGQNPKSAETVRAAYEANLAELRTAKPIGVSVELGQDGTVTLDTADTAPLKSGDMIGTFRVSRGTIKNEQGLYTHEGVDVATPEGTPLFVFGEKGESITVTCETQTDQAGNYSGWGIYGTFHVPSTGKSFLVAHLSECNPGTYTPGEVWGYSGNTGKSTGPHTHTEQFSGTKTGYAALPEEPTRAYVEAIHGGLE